jgi:hypothetical protein
MLLQKTMTRRPAELSPAIVCTRKDNVRHALRRNLRVPVMTGHLYCVIPVCCAVSDREFDAAAEDHDAPAR